MSSGFPGRFLVFLASHKANEIGWYQTLSRTDKFKGEIGFELTHIEFTGKV